MSIVFDSRKNAEQLRKRNVAKKDRPSKAIQGSGLSSTLETNSSGAQSVVPANPEVAEGASPEIVEPRSLRTPSSDLIWAATNAPNVEPAFTRQTPIVRSLLRARSAERGSTFAPAKLISRKEPAYPEIAERNLISGSVNLLFRVSPEGKVYDVKPTKGAPVLASTAIEAVKTWQYEPARLNGSPIDSQASAVFDFRPIERINARPASKRTRAAQEDIQDV